MTGPGMACGWALLVVAVGGAAGALGRHLLATAPWGALPGIMVANVAGSAALGTLLALVDSPELLLLLGTGLCGALTTWSTLAVQTTELARERPARAAAYLALTLLLGLGAALLALHLLG